MKAYASHLAILRTLLSVAIGTFLTTRSMAEVVPGSLVVNEIQVANIDMFVDPSVNYGGWIELYNPTSASVNLGGLYITDDPLMLKKFRLASDLGQVPSHGFKTIWFDHYQWQGGTDYSDKAYQQVDFKLNYEGGCIILSDGQKVVCEQTYPQAVSRTSYARHTDGGELWGYTDTPSLGRSNNGSTFAAKRLQAPQVSHDATVFKTPFTVRVDIPQGAILRYTTDGSTPTQHNGSVSEDGIFDVQSSVAYRFRLFQDGCLASPVVTRSYIQASRDYYFPIVSVVTDEGNLYDDEIGAYTRGTNGITGRGQDAATNKNRAWERPVNFEYLTRNEDGQFLSVLNQEVDFQVCGGWSRHNEETSSSFKLKASKVYEGQNTLDYAFFASKPYIKSKALQIRNGGNDGTSWTDEGNGVAQGRIKDASLQEMVRRSGLYVDLQSWQPAHIFINGQYHRMFNVREPNNKAFAYANYGIDNDSIDQFEVSGSYRQMAGDDTAFMELFDLTEQLAASPANAALYEQVCQRIDVDEFCNYMAVECFLSGSDWLTNNNNVKGFRDRHNGKFHFVLMDLDFAFNLTNVFSSLEGTKNNKNLYITKLFFNMLKCQSFRKQFVDAYSLVAGSVFDRERYLSLLNDMAAEMEQALSYDGKTPWNSVSIITNRLNRIPDIIANMEQYFKFEAADIYNVRLSSNVPDAAMMLNGQPIPTGRFSGHMYAPITLQAQAPAGYRFKGWRTIGGVETVAKRERVFDLQSEWYYYDQGSLDGKAWNGVTFGVTSWGKGKGGFGYGSVGKDASQDYQTLISYGDDSQNKRPTYYFRKSFALTRLPEANEHYVLHCYVDDGFVVYLNGKEIGRYNMGAGTPSYSTYTSTYAENRALYQTIRIDNSLLRRSTNTIAVEVHNVSATSSDIYWDAYLEKTTTQTEDFCSTDELLTLSSLPNVADFELVAEYEPLAADELLNEGATPIRINELSAANDIYVNDYYKRDDWVELYNTTDQPVDVAGMYLSDDETQPQKFQIPCNDEQPTVIPPHGHLILWASKRPNIGQHIHTNFKLSNADSKAVLLTSADGSWSDRLVYSTHGPKETVGLFPNGGKRVYRMTAPTILADNTLTSSAIFLYENEYSPIINLPEVETFTLSLAEGWNWVSHPLDRDVALSEINRQASRIQNQWSESVYDPSLGWTGSVSTLSPTSAYKVQMLAADEVSLVGLPFTEGNTIQLHKGWNWIGYPVRSSQTLTSALSGFRAAEGDMIVGQDGFATYEQGQWGGSLEVLTTGQGYLYKSDGPKSLVFAQADGTAGSRKARFHQQPQSPWTASPTAHPNVMGLVAQVAVDGMVVPAGAYSVAAFSPDGECRGVGRYVDGTLYITVYGDADEEIRFRVSDAGTGIIHEVSDVIPFCADVVGSRRNPVTLHVGQATGFDTLRNGQAFRSMDFYTLDGLHAGTDRKSLLPGIYVATVTLHDGRVVTKKIVVR